MTGQTMKVHQAIARCLADNGVTSIFGLMGDGNMFMCTSFIRDCGGEFIASSMRWAPRSWRSVTPPSTMASDWASPA